MSATGLPRTATASWAVTATPALQTCACVLLVAALAALNYLAWPQRPAGLVWDEGYYVTSTERYAQGRAQFGTHPPLGLLLLAAGDALLQPNAGLDTSALAARKHVGGDDLPAGYAPTGMRLASGAAATLAALVLFALALTLTGSRPAALVMATLFVFDTALVAHLRAAHLDAFQLLFTLLALWAFTCAVLRERAHAGSETALGLFAALAMLVKLNAAWLLLPAATLLLVRLSAAPRQGAVRRTMVTALRMLGAGMLATLLVLTAHVAIGHRPPDSRSIAGTQDAGFISGNYQAYLQRERGIGVPVLLDAASDYARFMAADIRGVGQHDSNGSSPWQWLYGQRSINYRWDSDGQRTRYVQLAPNPVGWWLATLAPLATLVLLVLAWFKPVPGLHAARQVWMAAALLAAWTACLVLHLWIASQRVMYLYHAFSGLLLGFLLALLAWQMALQRWPVLRHRQGQIVTLFISLQLAAFLWLSPLALHQPLTHAACQQRNAIAAVVECRP